MIEANLTLTNTATGESVSYPLEVMVRDWQDRRANMIRSLVNELAERRPGWHGHRFTRDGVRITDGEGELAPIVCDDEETALRLAGELNGHPQERPIMPKNRKQSTQAGSPLPPAVP